MQEISQTWEEKLRKTEKIHQVRSILNLLLFSVFILNLKFILKYFFFPLGQERQQALEKMGISVQASGIKVEQDKYYLVNLNADPSLNELLVYYLKVIYSLYKCALLFLF